jgi:hypothetical protein
LTVMPITELVSIPTRQEHGSRMSDLALYLVSSFNSSSAFWVGSASERMRNLGFNRRFSCSLFFSFFSFSASISSRHRDDLTPCSGCEEFNGRQALSAWGLTFLSASLILSSFPFFPHDDTYSFYDEHFRIDFRLDFHGGSPNDGPF